MKNINDTFIIDFSSNNAFSTFFSWFHPFIVNNINGLNGQRDRNYFNKITAEIQEMQKVYKTFPKELISINLLSLPLTFVSYEQALAKNGGTTVTQPIDTSNNGALANILIEIFMLFKNYGNPVSGSPVFSVAQRKETADKLTEMYRNYGNNPLYAAWIHEITKSMIIRWNQLDFYREYEDISSNFRL